MLTIGCNLRIARIVPGAVHPFSPSPIPLAGVSTENQVRQKGWAIPRCNMANPVKNFGPEWRFWAKVHITEGCWEWTGARMWQGYGHFGVGGKVIRSHRYAYQSLVGLIPDGMFIDHICFNHACVNPSHMRLATPSQNTRNQRLQASNTSGYKGVSWSKASHKWRAYISINNIQIHLGLYTTRKSAYAAYCEAAMALHKEFANSGESHVPRF